MKKIIFLIILVSFSCKEYSPVYNVDPELKPFVDSFFHEGEIRGVFLPNDNLIMIFSSDSLINGMPYNGYTKYETGYNADPQIRSYINFAYFKANNNPYSRLCLESTIFHELGHGILKRQHTNTSSIMNTSIRCYLQKHAVTDSSSQREQLLDELFHHKVL